MACLRLPTLRSGSVKRVSAAVGEGVDGRERFVHAYIARPA